MKQLSFTVFLLIGLTSYAQDTLSYQDFNNLSYPLKAGINISDSASIMAEFERIASPLFADAEQFTIKPIKQQAMLKDVYYSLIAAAMYQKNYSAVIKYADEARKISYKKKQVSPPFYLERAYASAKLHPVPNKTFAASFSDALINEVKMADTDFIKDIASQLKGALTKDAATSSSNRVHEYLEEAVKTNTPVVMYNMPYIMKEFFTRNIIINNGEQLIQALNTISPGVVEMEIVKIPMRDGIKLSGMLFRDLQNKEKVPVIISQSPYPGGNEAKSGNIYAVNGYVFLYVDCRGRRESEGTFFPYENDARDFYDIIDWATKQSWCNGKAGTTGGSYLGFTQWQAIRTKYRHPALKAINPMAAVGFGVDFPRLNNAFTHYNLIWASYVQGKSLNSALFDNSSFWMQKEYELYRSHIPFASYDSVAEIDNPFFKRWIQHPDFDRYWQDILPAKQDYEKLDIPVLTTTGYYDADQNGATYYYYNHIKYNPANKHFMIIGPFDHGGSQWMPAASVNGKMIDEEAQVPLYKHVIQWFDWALKGKKLPAFFKNKVNYYDQAAGQWKGVSSLAAATKDSLKLYLTSTVVNGLHNANMQLAPGKKDTVFSYSHDIFSTRDSMQIFAPKFDSAYTAFNRGIEFTSLPMQRDYTLTGSCVAHLLTSINVPDADLVITIEIKDSTGKEETLGYTSMRTRYRYSSEHPKLMTPGKPEALNFVGTFYNVMKIPKGSVIKLYLEVRNSTWIEKNYGFGGEVSKETATGPRIITPTIYAGKMGASYIAIPLGTGKVF